ncbi:MAG: bifunctional oligoribonuclease/PAP phosphatase NrnA [Deltaproteobacteria bacterium]|nr:MAG: bifunctional oligoribonuclease/PAP phosphatase NrnA [Deltaproteobacteria bacterium]
MIAAIARELRNNERFLLTTHVNPDGDAIGSLGALSLVLEDLGKKVVAYCQDEIPGFLRFLPYSDRIVREIPGRDRFDVAVVLDCGELDRIGNANEVLRHVEKIIHIDHHSSSDDFGQLNLVLPGCSSTAEILYEIFQAIPASLSLEAAENIYTAILTDTGSFRFANTTARALDIAAEMVGLGVAPDKIASEVYDSMSPERLRLLALSLNTLTLRASGRLATMQVSRRMLEETETTVMDTDGFVNYPRGINTAEMAIFFREMDSGKVNVSLRSRGRVNVAEFARNYDGGGHHNAAAFRAEGSLTEVVEKILAAAEEFIAGGSQ